MKKKLAFLLALSMIVSSMTAFASECTHQHTKSYEETPATCTDKGYTEGIFCEDEKIYISGHREITPLGHLDSNNDGYCEDCGAHFSVKPKVNVTCTKEGYSGDTVNSNGRIVIGEYIQPIGHEDINMDFICDICNTTLDKKNINVTLHYYITNDEYENNKNLYSHTNVKDSTSVPGCKYITEKVSVKQAEVLTMPDFPQLARYDFKWMSKEGVLYTNFKFSKDTEIYMAYVETKDKKTTGQCGNDAYWKWLAEEEVLYFYGNGELWNDWDKRTELPWYEYLSQADKVKLGNNVTVKLWHVYKKK